jgi:hypothetical protein
MTSLMVLRSLPPGLPFLLREEFKRKRLEEEVM